VESKSTRKKSWVARDYQCTLGSDSIDLGEAGSSYEWASPSSSSRRLRPSHTRITCRDGSDAQEVYGLVQITKAVRATARRWQERASRCLAAYDWDNTAVGHGHPVDSVKFLGKRKWNRDLRGLNPADVNTVDHLRR